MLPHVQDLLDDMRRRVYAGDLALTDGWGAYLVVQVHVLSGVD